MADESDWGVEGPTDEAPWRRAGCGEDRVLSNLWDGGPFAGAADGLARRVPGRLEADPDNADRGLAQLVLTLVDLLRRLMERQAVRRLESGGLTEDQVEALGQAFMKMEARMDELKAHFQLGDEDLNLDLGPLGDLL
ncbi:MAG TPA: gas vesicle protein K [Acidimicrobiales bacterium]|nr:gas vesicle protein K [Acidimicrobiales bacterium]